MERSAAELEAAKGLVDIKKSSDAEMVKASKILVSMKDSEILELQAATLTLLGINRIQTPVSEKILKDEFQQIPLKQVVDNANFLVKYGLIPEIELVDEQMEGGEKRARTPSRVMLEAAQSAPDTKSEKQQDAIRASNKKAKRDELLNNIDVTKQFDNKTYDDLEPYIQELGKRICNPKMTGEFVNALFPPVAVNEWKNELNKEFRAIYEPSSPDTQCNNTIGKSELVKECYICGFDMDNTIPDFAASCDHILPIIQAIFFLDLYRTDLKKNYTSDEIELLKKEYGWAHFKCNHLKLSDSYLETNLGNTTHYPSWNFGNKPTKKILRNIYNGFTEIQNKVDTVGFDKWIETRVEYIKNNKMKPIVDYIHSKGMGGTIMLIGFKNCVDTSKLNNDFNNILLKLQNKSGGKITIRRKNKSKSKTRKRTFSRKRRTNGKK